MIALACPTIDAGGHPAGLVSNCAAVHAFCRVVRREGSCLGSSTLTSADVRLGPERAGDGELRGEARAVGSAGFTPGRDREFRSELQLEQSAASNGLVTLTGSWSAGLAGSAPEPIDRVRDLQRVAVGRVEDEARPVHVDADVADVHDDPLDDVRDRFASPPAMTSTCAVVGSMCSARRTTTVPRSNGPTFALVIDDDRQRRAVDTGRRGRSCLGSARARCRRRPRRGNGRFRSRPGHDGLSSSSASV